MKQYSKEISGILKSGGIGILPTDTIYGIVGSALNKETVRRIYRLRKRNLRKPMIILIDSISDLKMFGVKPSPTQMRLLRKFWPHLREGFRLHQGFGGQARLHQGFGGQVGGQAGKVSVILPLRDKRQRTSDRWKYLHRGTNTLAFRLPSKKSLRNLLKKTGPLVAPSANPEGKPPAKTIKEAKRYFKNKIDFYLDGGRIAGKPSKLIQIEKDKIIVLRG